MQERRTTSCSADDFKRADIYSLGLIVRHIVGVNATEEAQDLIDCMVCEADKRWPLYMLRSAVEDVEKWVQ